MNQQRLEVTKLTLKLADSNWEIFNSYPNSATPYTDNMLIVDELLPGLELTTRQIFEEVELID